MDLYIEELKYLLKSPFSEIFVSFPWFPLYMFKIKLFIGVYIRELKRSL